MEVCLVGSEMAPYSKVGGLGDVLGSLPQALVGLGAKATVVIPHLPSMDADRWGLASSGTEVEVTLDGAPRRARVLEATAPGGVRVLFVDHPPYFHREGLYGTPAGDYPDNAERFAFFSFAALEAIKLLVPGCQVVHTHDWQTGLVPFLLKAPEHYGADPRLSAVRSVHTIHNLSYQGLFPADVLPSLGIAWSHFHYRSLEFYGKLNFLKAGLVHSDALTTVSPTYAREIRTPEFGCGLEGVLAERADALQGILNGIDPETWDPQTDSHLAARFSADTLGARAENGRAVRAELCLPEDGRPLLGVVNRLVAQKGIDLLLALGSGLEALGLQWAILGTGDTSYEAAVAELAGRHPGTVAARIGFDEALARRIYGGSDLFCMPSHFEPCGLGQMIALRYASLPVVRRTGGLADSVRDVAEPGGVGFVFDSASPEPLGDALRRAAAFLRRPRKLTAARRRAMGLDFSWEASARRYLEVYSNVDGHLEPVT